MYWIESGRENVQQMRSNDEHPGIPDGFTGVFFDPNIDCFGECFALGGKGFDDGEVDT